MYLFLCLVIMAFFSYFPRVVPLTLFNRKIESIYIRSLLKYIPYAVLGSMTFPTIFYSTSNILYSTIGTLVALLLAYFEKSLLIVALSSVITVYFLMVIQL